jgi:hypothetical protein
MQTVRELTSNQVPTSLRLQPILPGHEEHIDQLIREAGESGAFHVAAEFLKVGSEASAATRSRLNRSLGINVAEHYKQAGAKYVGREHILPVELRLPHHKRWRQVAHRYGMTYGFADLDLLHRSDGSCCCSGIDTIQGFNGFSRFTVTEATKKAMELDGLVVWDHISRQDRPQFTISHWVNSKVRKAVNVPSAPMEAYIRSKWISPSTTHLSPAMFHGVQRSSDNPDQFIIVDKEEL